MCMSNDIQPSDGICFIIQSIYFIFNAKKYQNTIYSHFHKFPYETIIIFFIEKKKNVAFSTWNMMILDIHSHFRNIFFPQ